MDSNPSLNTGVVSRVYASVGGLMAFVVAVIAGLQAQNGAAHILMNALFCMVACYLVGTLLGAVAEHAIRAHLARFKGKHPVPEPAPALTAEQAKK